MVVMTTSKYSVTATMKVPDFEAERRYVLTERSIAERQMQSVKKSFWSWLSQGSLGIHSTADWSKYITALSHYNDELDRHEKEIDDGLLPLLFEVHNESESSDFDLHVEVIALNAAIHGAKKPPMRPARMDGAPNKALKPHFQLPSNDGFRRYDIHIGTKHISSKFSTLRANDRALVVNRAIYFLCNGQTELFFSLSSRNVPTAVRQSVILDF
jgi:hypothetical protein